MVVLQMTSLRSMNTATTRALCAALCAFALASAPVMAQAGAPAVSAKLLDGSIETTVKPQAGTNVQWGRAVVLIDAPVERVMQVVSNYASYQDFLPNFESSRVLSQRGSSALVYVQVKILKGAARIWAELKLRALADQGTTKIIEGRMTKGNVKHFHARWEVTPYDAKRTLVAIEMIVDPDLPVPSSIVTNENQKSAKKAVRALRERLTGSAKVASK
jgi:ribosome-associated toxin RatA of RatAB toxin-antitoxin module